MMAERSVLIVDDDDDVRQSVADALEEEGYRVSRAVNGKDALRLLRDEKLRPDVIVLDMMMPQMDGWAFRRAQQQDAALASIPVIIFTAYGVPSETTKQLGAAAFLTKPLRLDDLLRTVEATCGSGEP